MTGANANYPLHKNLAITMHTTNMNHVEGSKVFSGPRLYVGSITPPRHIRKIKHKEAQSILWGKCRDLQQALAFSETIVAMYLSVLVQSTFCGPSIS
jgi:hypothetical protein